jgi:hypothetical protein
MFILFVTINLYKMRKTASFINQNHEKSLVADKCLVVFGANISSNLLLIKSENFYRSNTKKI